MSALSWVRWLRGGACALLRAAMMAGAARGLVLLGAGKRAWRAVVAWFSAACLRVAALLRCVLALFCWFAGLIGKYLIPRWFTSVIGGPRLLRHILARLA